jgi:hypothetical protein
MAKLTGPYIKVLIDKSTTAKDVSADIESIDVPDDWIKADMTGFGEGVENSAPVLPTMVLTIVGKMNPATDRLYDVALANRGLRTGQTVTIQIGQNAAPTTGDPEIEGEFWQQKMTIGATPKSAIGLTLVYEPLGGVAPTFGTV